MSRRDTLDGTITDGRAPAEALQSRQTAARARHARKRPSRQAERDTSGGAQTVAGARRVCAVLRTRAVDQPAPCAGSWSCPALPRGEVVCAVVCRKERPSRPRSCRMCAVVASIMIQLGSPVVETTSARRDGLRQLDRAPPVVTARKLAINWRRKSEELGAIRPGTTTWTPPPKRRDQWPSARGYGSRKPEMTRPAFHLAGWSGCGSGARPFSQKLRRHGSKCRA